MEPNDRPNRRMRTASVLMACALVALAASAALFVLPVRNPGVQNCGSPAWFLLRAQADRPLVDSAGEPIHGWDSARLHRAVEQRCSVQVARRAVPGGILLVVFWVVVVIAVAIGSNGRRALSRSTESGSPEPA